MKMGVTKYFYFTSKYVSREFIWLGKKEMSGGVTKLFYETVHKFLTNIAVVHLLRSTLQSIILHCFFFLFFALSLKKNSFL